MKSLQLPAGIVGVKQTMSDAPLLNKRFTIGRLTPPSQRLTVSSPDVDANDLHLPRQALVQTHQEAEVELKTEYVL